MGGNDFFFNLGIYRIYLGNYKEGVTWNVKEKACIQVDMKRVLTGY